MPAWKSGRRPCAATRVRVVPLRAGTVLVLQGYWRNRKRACLASTRYWDRNPDTPAVLFCFSRPCSVVSSLRAGRGLFRRYSIGAVPRLVAPVAPVRFRVVAVSSRLAQLVERKTLNLVVVGSSPTVGVFAVYLFF